MKYQVTCVCGGYGFPISASAARITMVAKSLREHGIGLNVLHCGPSPIHLNKLKSGVHDGIPFRYTTSVSRPDNKLLRLSMYLWGVIGLTFGLAKLWPVRRSSVVYLYVMDGLLNLYAGVLCQLLGLPVIQELCEWVPDQPNSAPVFNRWLYRRRIFRAATGALVISKAIEKRTAERCVSVRLDLLIFRLPVMVDACRFATTPLATSQSGVRTPDFVYCGTYLKDIFFLVRAFALVRMAGYNCNLTIIGECGEKRGREIMDHAREQGISDGAVILTGCVDENTLESLYKSAVGLLMPLWNDDKSVTRLPNKMGEYLASGRPVVTCGIGDLTEVLIDNVNAYVGEPGNEPAFAEKMMLVLKDPLRAEQIGAEGKKECFAHFDYRNQSSALTSFVVSCIERHAERRSTPRAVDRSLIP